MSVRLKVISIVALSITFFVLVIYLVGSKVLINDYLEIEKEGAQRNLERIEDAIKNSTTQLEVKISDWAVWDDSYKFVKDQNKAFIKSNLSVVSLQNLQVYGVIFYNASGKLVYHVYDDTDTAYASAIEEYLSGHPDILKHTSTAGSRIGIVALKNSNFLVASKPIVTSNGDGPIAGTLVFVKKFGSEEAKNLSELTHIDLKMHPFGSQEPTITDIKQNLLRQPFVVQYQSENVIVGHALLKDISNEPAIVVEIQMERKVYLQGKQTTFYFMIIAGLFIVFFGIVMIVLIEKTIIQRLTLVKKQTFEIGKSKDLSKRIAVTGDDEISSLSRSINTMLDDLKKSESTRVEVMKSNVEMSNKLSERLLEMEKINTLMVGREIKMIELKRRIKELEKEIKSKLKK